LKVYPIIACSKSRKLEARRSRKL